MNQNKKKATELIDKYYHLIKGINRKWSKEQMIDEAKQCALIAVEGIIEEYKDSIIPMCYGYDESSWKDNMKYWQQVKEELEKP